MMQPQNTPQETGDKIAIAAILAVILFPVALLIGFFQLVRRPLSALLGLVLHGQSGESETVAIPENQREPGEREAANPQVQYSDPPFGGRSS